MDTFKLDKVNDLKHEIDCIKRSISNLESTTSDRKPVTRFNKEHIVVVESRSSRGYDNICFHPFTYLDDEDVEWIRQYVLSKLKSRLAVLEARFEVM